MAHGYDACRAIYASAAPAVELLAERDALPYRHCDAVPDYWCELPEDKAPTGRVLVPRDARESMIAPPTPRTPSPCTARRSPSRPPDRVCAGPARTEGDAPS
jgi:hypothetical protein